MTTHFDTETDKSPYVTVSLLGSGYAALVMKWYPEDNMWDVCNTGIGRYKTRKEAEQEARDWAKADELRLYELED